MTGSDTEGQLHDSTEKQQNEAATLLPDHGLAPIRTQTPATSSSPFEAAAQKPHKDTRRPPAPSHPQRQKSNKPGSEHTSRASSFSALQRAKSGPASKAAGDGSRPHAKGRGSDTSAKPPAGQRPGALPHTKSTPHLAKTSAAKAMPSKDKPRASSMKRSVSWNELQYNSTRAPPERTTSGNLAAANGQPKPAQAKSLLQKLQSAGASALEKAQAPRKPMSRSNSKAQVKLPVLAPMEKNILASVGEREWIKIDTQGAESVFKKDKHRMTHELGIQIRDLRLLDPLMTSTYPSAILFRDKALVVNLEHIKCIITRDCTLILDANEPLVKAFAQQLQQRLKDKTASILHKQASMQMTDRDRDISYSKRRWEPPYELKALETVLDNVCRHLESLYVDLEDNMRPMLGARTVSKVTSDYLERLRRLKTRLVRLRTRVETLKEALDKILGDEGDMKAIHLSGKVRAQQANFFRRLARQSLRGARGTPHAEGITPQAIDAHALPLKQEEDEDEEERDMEEVEMLLSPYHLNLDSTWNKLQDISEFVDDAEELMSLEMDTYRNNNLRMRLFVAFLHCFGTWFWSLTNVFGMNLAGEVITAEIQPDGSDTYHQFLEVTISFSAVMFVLLLFFTSYLHYKRLSFLSIST